TAERRVAHFCLAAGHSARCILLDTAMQFVSGWLVDRFDVNLVIGAGYLLWSLATATTGIVQGFTILLMMRLMLGIGESVAFPSCSKILARQLPEHHRGFANGVIQSAL